MFDARRRAPSPSPLRPGKCMTRSELADAVNRALTELYPEHQGIGAFYVDDSWISNLERGAHHWANEKRRAALRRALGVATDAEIGLYPPVKKALDLPLLTHDEATKPGGPAPVAEHSADTFPATAPRAEEQNDRPQTGLAANPVGNCRAGGQLIAATLAPGARVAAQQPASAPHCDIAEQELTLESTLEPFERLALLTDATFTDGKIEQVDELVQEIINVYEAEGPRRVVPKIVRQRARLTHALSGFERPRHQEAIYRYSAMLAGMVAYAAVNLGKFSVAKAYCAESFGLAEFVENDDLRAWVRGTESFCAYYEGDYRRAAELARDGRRFAKDGPQAVRLLVNGEARALAKLGDRDGTDRAVQAGLTLAARHGRQDGMSPCLSFDAYSDARTISNAVTAYTSLGLPEKVNELLRELVPVVDESDSVWSKSLVRLDRAQVLLNTTRPEPEEAAGLAVQALTISVERPIASILIRAREVHSSAAPWKHLDGVRRLGEALAECERR